MYQQQQNFAAYPHTPLQEQDWGNLVLSELKRTAREYATAALEATHPAVRQTFQSLAQKTMQEQAELYTVLSQLNGYGSVKMAAQHEVQQELQQHGQKAEQLQNFVQQAIQESYAAGAVYQQSAQQQSYQQSQPFQQPPQYASYEQQGGYRSSAIGASLTGSTAHPSSGSSYGQSQGQSPTYSSQTGSGFSYSQDPVSQSISNNYSASAAHSPVDVQDYSSSSNAQQSASSSRSGSSQLGVFNVKGGQSPFLTPTATSSARGGNSFDWTDDDDAQESSANRGGNSFDWTASETQ